MCFSISSRISADGGFYFTARDHERLIHRPKPGHDHATPSGNAVAAWVLGRLAALTGEERYARAAERTLELFHPAMRDYPGGFAMMAIALDEHLAQPRTLILQRQARCDRAWRQRPGARIPARHRSCSRSPMATQGPAAAARQAAPPGAGQRLAVPRR